MVGKKRKEKFNISNKLAYTLIVILSIILIGVGVYAYGGSSPVTMGHSLGEIAPPAGCGNNYILTWTGSAWTCVAPTVADSRFAVTTDGLCYTAPETCALTTESCMDYNNLFVTTLYECSTMTQTENDDFCLSSCSTLGFACDGRNSICSGGTFVTYTSAAAVCEGGFELFCSCYTSGDYQLEHYTPAGQRCI